MEGREEPGGSGAAPRFAEALRELYEAAGRPLYSVLVTQARRQVPPVALTDASLSDWFNGGSVPSNPAAVRFLTSYLQGRAKDRPRRSEHEWERLRGEAQRERRANRGGRPARSRPSPSAEAPVRADAALPAPLRGLLRVLGRTTDDLPYRQRGPGRVRLSTVYVRQSVATASTEHPHHWPWADAHEPFDVRKEEPLRVSGSAQPFEEVFQQHDHLVIEGAAGLGKTTLGYHLVGELAETLLEGGEAARGLLVPLIVPARVLAARPHRTWAEALRETVAAEHGALADGPIEAGWFTGPVGGRRWLIVVDALDEIPDQDDRERLLTTLAARMSDPDGAARFLITTRPLSQGETVLLHGPRVGFYELQPFDERALELFARNWFDPHGTPAGAVAAQEFLDQVRTAGLQEVVQVPLLATVAAHVHRTRRDRTLPSSRYELYEEYIAQYSQARTAAVSCAPSETDHLLNWLNAHRVELLEELGTAYTTTETPLIEVAERLLSEHPRSPGPLPADWDETVAAWLCRTGMLRRQGPRLRFLHQTFAEHLAATARARTLPPAFRDNEEPPWDDLVRDLLLDDEQAQRVVLHYLHLHGTGTGLLSWLQNGSRSQRDSAARLIEQGAPCQEGHLEDYLVRVENKVLTGTESDLAPMAALTRHSVVRARLQRLLARPALDPETKIAIVGLLRDHLPQARREHTAFLTSLTSEAQVSDIRRRAAKELAKFGGEHRARAADVLLQMADDRGADFSDRSAAARELAKLGGEYRVRMAEVFLEMATDPTAYFLYRLLAVEALAESGGEYRAEAAGILLRMSTDPALLPVYQALALSSAADIEPDHRDRAAEALLRSLTNPANPSYYHRLIVQKAAELGGEYRALVAESLYQVAVEPAVDFYGRCEAAKELAKFGGERRRLAAEALMQMANDPAIYPGRRRWAAKELTEFGGEYHARAAEALLDIATDPVLSVDERCEAAEELSKLGSKNEKKVLEVCGSLLSDPRRSAAEGIWAAAVLVALKPETHALAAELIYHMATAPGVGADARFTAAKTLSGLGPGHLERSAEIFQSLIDDKFSSFDHIWWAAKAVMAEGGSRFGFKETLRGMSLNPTVELWERNRAAHILAEFGEDVRSWFGEVLLQMVNDPFVEFWDRRGAAEMAVKLGAEIRSRAAEALLGVTADPATGSQQRRQAAETLIELGGEYRARGVEASLRIAADPGARISDQALALTSVARVEPEYRLRAVEALMQAIATPAARSWERRRAAEVLAEFGGEHQAQAAEALLRMLADPAAGSWECRCAAKALANFGGEHGIQAAEAFSRVVAGFRFMPSERVPWMKYLAEFGGEYRVQGVEALSEMAADPAGEPAERHEAARELAHVEPARLGEAINALERLTAESGLDPFLRRWAAETLMQWGERARAIAVEALQRLAEDEAADGWNRVWAAEDLADLGPEARVIAARSLERIRSDPRCGGIHRALATAALAGVKDPCHYTAIDLLTGLAAGSGADGWERQQAVKALVRMHPHHFDRAMRLLKEIAEDRALRVWDRRQAAESLARRGAEHQRQAVGLLSAMMEEESADSWERSEAALALAELSFDHRAHTAEVLRRIAMDDAVSPRERRYAARILVKFGSSHRDDGTQVLSRIMVDSGIPAEERHEAFTDLFSLGASSRDMAGELVRRMLDDPASSHLDRAVAAEMRDSLDRPYEPPTAHMLLQQAADTSEELSRRRRAARDLALYGASHREEAVRLLLEMLQSTENGSLEEALTRAALADLDPARRRTAAEALGALAENSALTVDERCRVLQNLSEQGPRYRHEAVFALRALVLDGTADSSGRFQAALTLAGLLDVDRVTDLRLQREQPT